MNDLDFIFDKNEYKLLKNAYDKKIAPHPEDIINKINNLIESLKNNSFQMPLYLQNDILNNLLQVQNILYILHKQDPNQSQPIKNSLFDFMYNISNISMLLNSHIIKSPYQVLYLKANNLLLQCLNKILKYFTEKTLKIFKFI